MFLSIGELARRSGVKVPTVRYYESIELLPRPDRSAGNQRRYDGAALSRLQFIRHARDMGFSIDDIRQLIELSGHPDQTCAEADLIARKHLDLVSEKIERLSALRGELARMVDKCRGGTLAQCHVIEVIADHRHCVHDH